MELIQRDVQPPLPLPIVAHIYHTSLVAVFMWEFIVTIPAEIRLMWTREWALIKLWYFANRYITFAFCIIFLSATYTNWGFESCYHFDFFEPEASAVIVLFAQLILLTRTYALWGKSKIVLWGLLILLALEAGVIFSAGSFVTPQQTTPSFTGCVAAQTSRYYSAFYIGPLVFDFIIFCLTLYRTIQVSRVGENSLIKLLQRDGIVYYLVVFLVNLLNMAFDLQPDVPISAMNAPAATILTSIMASRIVLSLKSFRYMQETQHLHKRPNGTSFGNNGTSFNGSADRSNSRPARTDHIAMVVTQDSYRQDAYKPLGGPPHRSGSRDYGMVGNKPLGGLPIAEPGSNIGMSPGGGVFRNQTSPQYWSEMSPRIESPKTAHYTTSQFGRY